MQLLLLRPLFDKCPPQTLVYRRSSHFRCYCGGQPYCGSIYCRQRFICSYLHS